MLTIWLDLPLPPSSNEMYENAYKGRVKTRKYKEWIEAAGWSARAALAKKDKRAIVGVYQLSIYVDVATAGDIDNRVKAISDLLVSLRITDDDAKMQGLAVNRVWNVPPGRAWVAASKTSGRAECPWDGKA